MVGSLWQQIIYREISVVQCLPHTPPDTPPHRVDNGGVDRHQGLETRTLYRLNGLNEWLRREVTRFGSKFQEMFTSMLS